jgi:hypothetical protein
MPHTQRQYLLHYADQADNDLDRALQKLLSIKTAYEPDHPDHAAAVDVIMSVVAQAQVFLAAFRLKHM